MNPNVKQIFFGVVFFVAGLSLGWITGTVKSYKETAGIVADANFNHSSEDLGVHISLLQLLHAREYQTVSDKLETMVDNDLTALAHYPAPVIPSEDKVIQTISKAKAYREKYPVTGRSAELSGAIEKVFEKAGIREAPDSAHQ